MSLQDSLQHVLDRGPAPCRPARRNTYAERERLSRPLSEVCRTNDYNITLIEIVSPALVLLDALVVRERDPDHLVPAFNDPCLHLHSFGLDVLFRFDVYLAHNPLDVLDDSIDPYMIHRIDSITFHVGYQPSVTKPATYKKHEYSAQESGKGVLLASTRTDCSV